MPDQPVLFGKLGWVLLFAALFLIGGTAYFLPFFLDILKLSMPEKWASITRLVVQITIGSWVATAVMSIVRVIVWLRAVFAVTSLTKYENERKDIMYVRDFTLWFLGIMTVLAAYTTQWLS
jgi:hypothetical protein